MTSPPLVLSISSYCSDHGIFLFLSTDDPSGDDVPTRQQDALVDAQYSVDFVGSSSVGSNIAGFDADAEVHHDWTLDELAWGRAGAGGIYSWLEDNPADVLLVHAGS